MPLTIRRAVVAESPSLRRGIRKRRHPLSSSRRACSRANCGATAAHAGVMTKFGRRLIAGLVPGLLADAPKCSRERQSVKPDAGHGDRTFPALHPSDGGRPGQSRLSSICAGGTGFKVAGRAVYGWSTSPARARRVGTTCLRVRMALIVLAAMGAIVALVRRPGVFLCAPPYASRLFSSYCAGSGPRIAATSSVVLCMVPS